ncbi:hypothetical protein ACFLQ8_03010 [Candidatus Auribacterota bacterium]
MKLVKFGLILAILAGVAFCVLSVFLHKKITVEKAKKVELLERIEIVEGKSRGLEEERNKAKQQLSDIIVVKEQVETERDAAKEEARQLSALLEMEKREKEILKKKLKEKQQAALALMKQLRLAREEATGASPELKAQVGDLKGEKKELLSKLRETEAERDELNKQLEEMAVQDKPTVNLEDIFVRSELKFSGHVLVVNPKYNFIIVNIGEIDKLPVGEILIIHRGRKLIGKVRVDRVYEKMAACAILPEWLQKGEYPEEDDSVKKF